MSTSLLHRFCPEPHSAPISATTWDPVSGASATADTWGLVAWTPPGARSPSLVLNHDAAVRGALALNPGASLLAVGDDGGTLAVYKTDTGERVFVEARAADTGTSRAMRALAFHPSGHQLASLAVDGRIRLTDLRTWERLGSFDDFGGASLAFDRSGDLLLAIDKLGQAALIDLVTREVVGLPLVPGGVRIARFAGPGSLVITLGQAGISLVDFDRQEVVRAIAAQRSSGMLDVVLNPDETAFAVVSARSAHLFTLPDFGPRDSARHGAPLDTSDGHRPPHGIARWDTLGVAVGGTDGRLHRPDVEPSLPPVVAVAGVGDQRVAAHGHRIARWVGDQRKRPFCPKVYREPPDTRYAHPTDTPKAEPTALAPGETIVELRTDPDGRFILALPSDGPVHVYEASTGRLLFHAGFDTIETPRMEVGGAVVAVRRRGGGLRWFDLAGNRTFDLEWADEFALTGGGTWIAAITPRGGVRVVDPRTGAEALPPLPRAGDAPVRRLSFVHRSPALLTLDADGVLAHHDLAQVAQGGEMTAPARIAAFFDTQVDEMWGLSGGKHVALRVQEEGSATMLFVDLDDGEVVAEAKGLLPYAVVDPVSGLILEPAQGNALLERDRHGREHRVLRSLPRNQWLSFDAQRVLEASPSGKAWL